MNFLQLKKIKHLNWLYIIVLFITLSSCNNQTASNFPKANDSFNVINSGSITSVPLSVNNLSKDNLNDVAKTYLIITNTSNLDLNFVNYYWQSNITTIDNQLNVNTTMCSNLRARSNCQLEVMLPKKIGAYLIKFEFADKKGKHYFVSQIIRVEADLPDVSGFIYSTANTTLNIRDETVSLPILLNKDYNDIRLKASVGDIKLICPGNNYRKGSLCTILLSLTKDQLFENKEVNIIVTGLSLNQELSTTIKLNVSATTNAANIITSAINPVLNPATNPQQVFLYNSGNITATDLLFTELFPLMIELNTCSSNLSPGATCSFFIKSSLDISGQSSILVNYNSNTMLQTLSFNVIFLSQTQSPLITLTSNGDFRNVYTNNEPATLTITVKNSGNTDFTNLQFSNLTLQNSFMSYESGGSCVPGQTLLVNGSCTLIVKYAPTIAQAAGTVKFVPIAKYVNQLGTIITYSSSSLLISYSAVTTVTPAFVAAGDFGQVINSDTGSGVWSVSVDNPFPGASVTVMGLAYDIGTNTYVIVFGSNSGVRYSKLNGLFWRAATDSPAASNVAGVITDGVRFYIAGSGTAPRIIKSISVNNLNESWINVYDPTRNVNRLYYFNNGVNSAYLANLSNDIAVSANGTSGTWTLINFSGALPYTPAILGVGNTLFTFATNGTRSQRASITDLTTWIEESQNPLPSTSNTNGAIYDGSNYFVTNGSADIYTTINPVTVPFSLVFNGLGTLNDLAFGSGVYVAVGNGGLNVTSTNPTESGAWISNAAITIGQSTSPNLERAYFFNNRLWAVGANAIVNSKNGINWSTPSIVSITYNNNTNGYLVVDNQGNIYKGESNLITWTQQINPTNNILNYIKCIGENCYAIGENGTILSTTNNGTTWNIINSGINNSLKGLSCGKFKCVIVGESGVVLLSDTTLTNWQVESSGVTVSLNSVTFTGTYFVAVGDVASGSAVIRLSTDGVNWVPITSNATQNLNSVTYSNKYGCFAVGNAVSATTNTIRISPGNCGTPWASGSVTQGRDLLSVAVIGESSVDMGRVVAVGKGNKVISATLTTPNTWVNESSGVLNSVNNLRAVITRTPN